MVKRVFLFVLTNIAILAMVSIVLAVLGQLGVFDMAGGQGALLVLCAVWGFGAAFVSLLLSRWMAKRAMGVQLVGPETRSVEAQWLYNTVARLTGAAAAGAMDESDAAVWVDAYDYVRMLRMRLNEEQSAAGRPLGNRIDPELLNEDPHSEGWLIKMRFSSAADLKSLMNAEAYEEYVKSGEA